MDPRLAEILANLDERQRRAATLGPGPAQLIAPAGSGKTATLVVRVGVLIDSGVPAARILVVTFNRDATTELAHRINEGGRRPAPWLRLAWLNQRSGLPEYAR